MSNITDMGLPQGLPEMPSWPLDCTALNAFAQDYANRFAPENNNSAREMTAADLGLPLGQWAMEWLQSVYGPCTPPLWMWLTRPPVDAPYSFWLGRGAT